MTNRNLRDRKHDDRTAVAQPTRRHMTKCADCKKLNMRRYRAGSKHAPRRPVSTEPIIYTPEYILWVEGLLAEIRGGDSLARGLSCGVSVIVPSVE